MELNKLSLEEIREQCLRGDQPITAHFLNKLGRDPRQGVRKIYELLKKRYEKERTDRARVLNMLNFERVLWKSGIQSVAGIDEVGIGPLAGPVVAAAVVFPPGTELAGIDDSKRLDVDQRVKMEAVIRRTATAIGVGLAEVGEIDRLNIYHAALLAMRRAVEALSVKPDHLLIDARIIPDVSIPQNSFFKGDGINFSIAAASIIAKTHRDRLMEDLEKKYPGYGFAQHKGYGTAEHQNSIRELGPCPVHRMSFPFIRELCGGFSELFYELKQKLAVVDSAAGLRNFETNLKDFWPEMDEREQRKIRLMLSRRWKTI
ncbi:MAG TPA: ribonuclease HII [Candidatus Binatia bacterium]|jgi:ribonuclease HII|nr:ribonuclease HII [Candidatus Binatia bacterium]